MSKRNRPTWFKLFLHQKPLIDAVPDEVAGRALKAALRYFDSRGDGNGDSIGELDPITLAVFSAFKPYIDEAFSDFYRDVENGKKGGRPKKPPLSPPNPCQPPRTEAEADTEAEGETEEEAEGEYLKKRKRNNYN
ncbi:MAG: hypothetical protein IKC03_07855, partial [Oscillospiraceae bacterium]|nr:hypothetical protein [Oscillospiraceae bacterium]